MTPAARPSMATYDGRLRLRRAALRRASRARSALMPGSSSSRRQVPMTRRLPSTAARRPLPGSASKLVTSGRSRPRSCDAARSPRRGRARSRAPRPRRGGAAPLPSTPAADDVGDAGRPSVIVPVLSKTTVLSFCAVSSASPLRIRMPCSAPWPVPTMIAVGVARPRAQGQAMISTATAFSVA